MSSILDLFGNVIKSQEKTFEQEYQEYINSAGWKRKRDEKIKQAGYNCEKCGRSKWTVRLEVHHLNYDHFKKERMEDLSVLCIECHIGADEKRKKETIKDRSTSAVIVGFEKWMDKGNNPRWRKQDDRRLSSKWDEYLRRISSPKKKYDIPFWRSPKW